MDPRLIITNIGYTLTALVTLSLAVFVLAKNPRRPLNVIFFLLSLATLGFEVSHVVGVNATDPYIARAVFMWNLSNIFIVAFNYHWVLELLGAVRRRLVSLFTVYLSGAAFFVFYLFYPDRFLLLPVQKLYLPNYYVPGDLYLLMRFYFLAVSLYFIYHIFVAYKTTTDRMVQNRIKYVLVGVAFAYATGSSALFLVYDIAFDPIWSMFLGLYSVPFAYAILKYDLMDIRVVAKRALGYGAAVIFIGAAIGLVSFSNNLLAERIPGFPIWLIPFLSSAAAFGLGLVVWQKIREADMLKYEFITVVTHKFRTPLTYIKWATDNLRQNAQNGALRKDIDTIENAANRLASLTSLLLGLTDSENMEHLYHFEKISLERLVREILGGYRGKIHDRGLRLESRFEGKDALVSGDSERLKFVIQILLDNALIYTPRGGEITVSVSSNEKETRAEIKDSGIGIARNELPLVFSKFFRGEESKRAYTEGMGIGLFMAKTIIERHGGAISADSEGRGKGSVFSVSLPIAR